MRYIRTKDGIWEVENPQTHSTIFCIPKHIEALVAVNEDKYEMQDVVHKRIIGKDHWKTEIISQADTIKELCDEFLIKEEPNDKPYLTHRSFEESKNIVIGRKWKTLYGAIWVEGEHGEPILKSVAKLNEEGDLKLL